MVHEGFHGRPEGGKGALSPPPFWQAKNGVFLDFSLKSIFWVLFRQKVCFCPPRLEIFLLSPCKNSADARHILYAQFSIFFLFFLLPITKCHLFLLSKPFFLSTL
jgi:hypothetical protein